MIELKRNIKNKKSKLVGRGSKRGKTSGRGTKGQRARAGHKIRPEIRDTIKKYPKLRGRGKNINKTFHDIPAIVNIGLLATAFPTAQSVVTPRALVELKIIRRKKGVVPMVKILGTGEITHAITICDCLVTASAKTKIELAGGVIKGVHL